MPTAVLQPAGSSSGVMRMTTSSSGISSAKSRSRMSGADVTPGNNSGVIGIKDLRKSKLMKNAVFKSMYSVIEKHHQDIRLAHLTGKPKDLMESTQKDSKFYNILSKMLCEVLQQPEKEQKILLQKVLLWYKANKHVLYTGPRFGKEHQRKEAEEALRQARSPRQSKPTDSHRSRSILSQHSTHLMESEHLNEDVSEQDYPESCDEFSCNSVNSAIDLDLTTEVDYEEVLNRDSECSDTDLQDKMLIDITKPLPQRSSTSYSMFTGNKVQYPANRGPQKKMVHSIASLVNPHLHTPRKVDNSAHVSSVVFRPITAPNSRADMLKTWQAYNKERTYGQDIIGKMNFIGRSGTGLDIRYNAHELGEMPEYQTKHILKDVIRTGKQKHAKPKETKSNITSQTLEDFYDTVDKSYPVKVPKFKTEMPRSTLSRQSTPTVPLGRQLVQTEQPTAEPSKLPNNKSNVKLDTVIDIIDTVTDEMEYYKEKLIQPPYLGFRRPAVSDVPTTPTPVMSQIHYTSDSSLGRFNTPVQPPSSAVPDHMICSSSIGMTTSTPHTSLPQTPLPGIDWRGRITPEPGRYRSKQRFGGHTYVKKTERPSLRSAGSITTSHRPKTAPGPFTTKWKTDKESDANERIGGQASSHMTTSVNQSDVDNLMVIKHLVGDSASQDGSMYDYDLEYFRRLRRMNYSASGTSTNQQLEYLSLLATGQQFGEMSSRSFSAPVGHLHMAKDIFKTEDLAEKMCSSPVGFSSIGEYDEQELNEVDEELRNLKDDYNSVAGEQTENEEYNIEISAIPSEGQGPLPANQREQPLQALTISDAFQFSTGRPSSAKLTVKPASQTESTHSAYKGDNSHVQQKPKVGNPKQTIKTEQYYIDYHPDTSDSKVERSAGRMPGAMATPATQLIHMAQKQRASLQGAHPVRTPPSIPSPYNSLGTRSARTGGGQIYQKELSDHARKMNSPRRYLEHVCNLRERVQTAPAVPNPEEQKLMGSLQINQIYPTGDFPHSILKPQSALSYQHHLDNRRPFSSFDRPSVTFRTNQLHPDDIDALCVTPDIALRQKLEGQGVTGLRVKGHSPRSPATTSCFARIGRPIPQVNQIPDPDELMQAAVLQKQTSAAVDIQRIFRGYIARTNYQNLIKDVRENLEDSRKAALQIQRHYRGHLSRKRAIYNRHANSESLEWAKQYKQVLIENEIKRHEKFEETAAINSKNYLEAAQKLEVIGPHVDIYQVYHQRHVGASRRELDSAAVLIQTLVRGWLVRCKLKKLKRKAVCYGSSFPQMVKEYRSMLIRVQKHRGIEKYKTPFTISEMNTFMDNRRRYEGAFERRSFGGEIEATDVEQYFKECDLFPSQAEIEEAREIVCHKPGRVLNKEKGISKRQILDMVYYIYVPTATGLTNTRTSTWMNPIIDGQEAKKLIGSHLIEPVPLEKCAELVMEAKRNEREREQKKLLEQSQKQAESIEQ